MHRPNHSAIDPFATLTALQEDFAPLACSHALALMGNDGRSWVAPHQYCARESCCNKTIPRSIQLQNASGTGSTLHTSTHARPWSALARGLAARKQADREAIRTVAGADEVQSGDCFHGKGTKPRKPERHCGESMTSRCIQLQHKYGIMHHVM